VGHTLSTPPDMPQHSSTHAHTHTSKLYVTRGKSLPFQIRVEKPSELVQNSDTMFCDNKTAASMSSLFPHAVVTEQKHPV